MRVSTITSALATLSLVAGANAISPIVQKGRYFFTQAGNRWFIKGVAYQLLSTGPTKDPLVDSNQCTLDANLMKSLGANAIRVYHVDPTLNHDACMQIFANAGIYAFIDLDDYPSQLDQTKPQWTQAQFSAFQAVMDTFQKYDNTAGFFIGNEVINDGAMSNVALYIRAAIKDMKAYRAQKGYRTIPIGYSHADVASIGQNLEDYFACGDTSSMLEFYGLNSYRWCGQSSFDQSGYSAIYAQTQNYPIPIFMSETGCIVPEPRTFQDQTALLGPEMDDVWSGAIIYEWIQEENHYGLITYGGGNTDDNDYAAPAGGFQRSGTPTPVTPGFTNLQNVWATLNPTGSVNAAAYTPTLSPLACPTYQAGAWQVDPSAALPTIGGAYAVAAATATTAPSVAVTSAAATTTSTSTAPAPIITSTPPPSPSPDTTTITTPASSPVETPSTAPPPSTSIIAAPVSSSAAASSSVAVAPVPIVASSSVVVVSSSSPVTVASSSSPVAVVQSTTTIGTSSNMSSSGAGSSSRLTTSAVAAASSSASTRASSAASAASSAAASAASSASAAATHTAGALSGKDLTGGASIGLVGLLLGAGFWL